MSNAKAYTIGLILFRDGNFLPYLRISANRKRCLRLNLNPESARQPRERIRPFTQGELMPGIDAVI